MSWAELSWSEILLGRVVLSELSLGRVVLHPFGRPVTLAYRCVLYTNIDCIPTYIFQPVHEEVYWPAKSPDLGRRLMAFSLHCRLSSFDVHFTGEIENLLAFLFSDRLYNYLR